jgi:hypothetical protein
MIKVYLAMFASAVETLQFCKTFCKTVLHARNRSTARPRNTVPAYRKHKQAGRAIVSMYRADGSRTEVILPGDFGSEVRSRLSEVACVGGA